VEDRRIVSERNFESFGWGLGAGGWTRRRHADVPWRERRVRNHAVVQPAAPRGIVFGIDLPELANEVVARPLRPVAHRGEHFVRALAAVERGDQRLDDRRCAVVRARVAPRLQEMRFRNLPVAQLRRLVVVQAQMRAKLSLYDEDRKSTRLNSSHRTISYAVFCLKKKKKLPNCTHHTKLQ